MEVSWQQIKTMQAKGGSKTLLHHAKLVCHSLNEEDTRVPAKCKRRPDSAAARSLCDASRVDLRRVLRACAAPAATPVGISATTCRQESSADTAIVRPATGSAQQH